MSNNSKISWTTTTWNVTAGCDPISDGCKNCYARSYGTGQISEWLYPDYPS